MSNSEGANSRKDSSQNQMNLGQRFIPDRWRQGECGELFLVSGTFFLNGFLAITYRAPEVAAVMLGVGIVIMAVAIFLVFDPDTAGNPTKPFHNLPAKSETESLGSSIDRAWSRNQAHRSNPRSIELLELEHRSAASGDLRVRYFKLEE